MALSINSDMVLNKFKGALGLGGSSQRATMTIESDRVIDSWFALVKNGAGKDQWVLEKTEQAIKDFSAPNVACQKEVVSTGMFGEKRNFLRVVQRSLREYNMFIGARNYGRDLD